MDSKNYTQVLIDGKIYTLGGTEDEGYLQRVAAYVNEKLNIMRKLPGFTRQSSEYQNAMIQLNIADDYFKSMEQEKASRRQRDDMERESYSLKHELVGTQMKLEAVLKDLEERQSQMEETNREKNRLERRLREAERSLARQEVLLQAAAAREQEDRQALAEARRAAAFQQSVPAFKEAAAARESQMRVVKASEEAAAGDEEPAGESVRAGLVVMPGRGPEPARRAEPAANAGAEVVRLDTARPEENAKKQAAEDRAGTPEPLAEGTESGQIKASPPVNPEAEGETSGEPKEAAAEPEAVKESLEAEASQKENGELGPGAAVWNGTAEAEREESQASAMEPSEQTKEKGPQTEPAKTAEASLPGAAAEGRQSHAAHWEAGHGGKAAYSSKEELTRKALLAAMEARNMNHRKR